jgi:hypothetical protein
MEAIIEGRIEKSKRARVVLCFELDRHRRHDRATDYLIELGFHHLGADSVLKCIIRNRILKDP